MERGFSYISWCTACLIVGMIFIMPTVSAHGQSDFANSAPPPYEAELLRLVEILGALEHLHPLCGQQGVGVWKAQMANFLEAEAPDTGRRARFVAKYNTSYAALTQLYHSCTNSAKMIIARYEAEARALTTTLTTTYRPQAPQLPADEEPQAPREETSLQEAEQ